jgi:hypothetical protein
MDDAVLRKRFLEFQRPESILTRQRRRRFLQQVAGVDQFPDRKKLAYGR